MKNKFDFLHINYQAVSTIKEMMNPKLKADLCIISGLTECTDEEKKCSALISQREESCFY